MLKTVLLSTIAIMLVFQASSRADEVSPHRTAFYAYDRALNLNPIEKPLDENAKRSRTSLSFDSIHDQRVTSILAIPKGFKAPYPAIILVHGSGGSKEASYIEWASDSLVSQGFATLAIDTQYHGDRSRKDRSGDIHMPDSYTMRDGWIQSVVDIRRCVDMLESRKDVVANKIGYLGFSQGGMLGSVAGGIEPRLSCVCLAVPGGALMELVKHIDMYPLLKKYWEVKNTPETMKRIAEITDITDPIYYVGAILPRPLLIITALRDEIIPRESSDALIIASHAKPEQVVRVDAGHTLHPNVVFDIRKFFVVNLGKR